MVSIVQVGMLAGVIVLCSSKGKTLDLSTQDTNDRRTVHVCIGQPDKMLQWTAPNTPRL